MMLDSMWVSNIEGYPLVEWTFSSVTRSEVSFSDGFTDGGIIGKIGVSPLGENSFKEEEIIDVISYIGSSVEEGSSKFEGSDPRESLGVEF